MAPTSDHRSTDVVIIGAGQAGLAMSHRLTERSVDHVLLERGDVANSWRTERWDSLRLLTPNWMCDLPGWAYRGDDPDGFMTAAELVGHLDAYRRSFAAPVLTGTTVLGATRHGEGWTVSTDGGPWRGRAVVVASGAFSNPVRPPLATLVPPAIEQLSPIGYRRPDALADGAVLVVGASASGLQIADELSRAGREVTLAVGEHVRLPRTYRGRDIHWWLDAIGQLDERYDRTPDLGRARRLPSLQLIGTPERRSIDLNTLTARGVRVVGRLAGIAGGRAVCSGSLANVCKLADLKERRLLDRLDAHAAAHGLDTVLDAPHRSEATRIDPTGLEVDLGPVATIVWATGFRPSYPWLDPAALDSRGQIVHDGGVAAVPGLYVLGLPFLRRHRSSFISGAGPDATDLARSVARHLDTCVAATATF